MGIASPKLPAKVFAPPEIDGKTGFAADCPSSAMAFVSAPTVRQPTNRPPSRDPSLFEEGSLWAKGSVREVSSSDPHGGPRSGGEVRARSA